jgi:hypothetical protein
MPYLPAGVNGLDVLEVRVDSPMPRPLAILTHGTSPEQEKRAEACSRRRASDLTWSVSAASLEEMQSSLHPRGHHHHHAHSVLAAVSGAAN